MPWSLRSPQSFPAHFGRTLIEATTHEGRAILFGSYRGEAEADAVAEQFRHFRWCLRKQPGISPHLSRLEDNYQFRLAKDREYLATERWFILYLTATPDRVGQLVALNPHLASLIASEQA